MSVSKKRSKTFWPNWRNGAQVHHNFIDGKECYAESHFALTSPIDRMIILGRYPKGTAKDASDAMSAADNAFQTWRKTDLSERLRIFRKAAEIARKEKFDLAAILDHWQREEPQGGHGRGRHGHRLHGVLRRGNGTKRWL